MDRLWCSGWITAVSFGASLPLQRGRVGLVATERGGIPVPVQCAEDRLELLVDLVDQIAVDLLQPRPQRSVGLLGAFDIAGEVDQVDVAERLFLAGDLGVLHLFDQIGGAVGQILGLVLQRRDGGVQFADIADQFGAQRLGVGRDRIALPQVAFDGVEALPPDFGVDRGGLTHVDQIVEIAGVVADGEARQHEALHAGLRALIERPRLGVGRLRGVDVARLARRRRAPSPPSLS